MTPIHSLSRTGGEGRVRALLPAPWERNVTSIGDSLSPTGGGGRADRRSHARGLAAALLLALVLALPLPAAAAPAVPALTGPVVDLAGLLDGGSQRRLEALSRAAAAQEGGRGVQLQYLIVRTLDGEAIEDFSMRVAEAWRLGTREADNGVLVTVASEDRQVRIEVGQGLEGGLTDAQSSRITRNTIVPAFKVGRYGEGLYDAGVEALSALGALPKDVGRHAARGRPAQRLPGLGIVALVILSIVLRAMFGGLGLRGGRRFGGWGGGGFGGFGGGGGGSWGGGGGGFSGGGASGRW